MEGAMQYRTKQRRDQNVQKNARGGNVKTVYQEPDRRLKQHVTSNVYKRLLLQGFCRHLVIGGKEQIAQLLSIDSMPIYRALLAIMPDHTERPHPAVQAQRG
jgi:DNA invertase Pin-like site-specific DNA recombinase